MTGAVPVPAVTVDEAMAAIETRTTADDEWCLFVRGWIDKATRSAHRAGYVEGCRDAYGVQVKKAAGIL